MVYLLQRRQRGRIVHEFHRETFASAQVSALLVDGDGLLFNRVAAQFAVLTARYRLPASYTTRVLADAGGLMSYGDHRSESWRQAGVYVGHILKGDKPSDLPVLQPTTFELVVNMKTARALGLVVPQSILEPATSSWAASSVLALMR